MVELFNQVAFSCHGEEKKCLHIAGKHMPLCARCFGAILGHTSAIAMSFFIHFDYSIYFISALFLTIMFGDWWWQNKWHWYHSNGMRLITGILGGFAVAVSVITFILHLI